MIRWLLNLFRMRRDHEPRLLLFANQQLVGGLRCVLCDDARTRHLCGGRQCPRTCAQCGADGARDFGARGRLCTYCYTRPAPTTMPGDLERVSR